MTGEAAAPAEKLIKRYENRKLYDPEERRYVTLMDLTRMVAGGAEVRVVDQKTGDDLTAMVLAQVILEGIKEHTASVPRQVLSRLIRFAARPASGWAIHWMGPQEAAGRARAEVERIVGGLLGRGRLTLEEALALRQDVAGAVQRIVAEAQHGLEARVRGLLDRSEREGGIHPSLKGLKERLMSFEALLAEPRRRPARRGKAGAGAARRRRSVNAPKRKGPSPH